MIDIKILQSYYEKDVVLITDHAAKRFKQRSIKPGDIRNAVNTGEIIEQYPDDFPFPSCLLIGKSLNGQYIHVVMSDEGTSSRIITAYYPKDERWSNDYKTRKDVN